MSESTKQPTVDQRFNAFHLEVAVLSDRMSWVLAQMDADDQAGSVMQGLISNLENLLDAQDCRADPV